jgi:DNA-binding transcriptional LysR family regulator
MLASLDELRAFTAVYETGGFTAAGKRLALTTNAVSLRVQKLEDDLGVRLFVRTTRQVAPTEEGRTFYAVSAARTPQFSTACRRAQWGHAEKVHERAAV